MMQLRTRTQILNLERRTLDWKPVKLITNGRRDVGKFWDVENESRRGIEDRLQTVQP